MKIEPVAATVTSREVVSALIDVAARPTPLTSKESSAWANVLPTV
ncbi:hypothetical protein [Corynebacterium sp. CCUG 71335]|nr:hypothetical protein [Corynebacterium sp. CCUG 71335]